MKALKVMSYTNWNEGNYKSQGIAKVTRRKVEELMRVKNFILKRTFGELKSQGRILVEISKQESASMVTQGINLVEISKQESDSMVTIERREVILASIHNIQNGWITCQLQD